MPIIPAPPQLARHRDENKEHDARRTEHPLPRNVVLAVRVDDRFDLGKPLVGLVMIDDDHVGAETCAPAPKARDWSFRNRR